MATLWDGRRVPFTMIGGYLGAGKTTLLNHLIRHAAGRRLVVLVNDVGAVNVDAAMIAAHDGATMSLTNGCVCCSIADDLGLALENIREMSVPPDQIVMELSGVAEPARITAWASTAGFRLDGTVVVVDAEQVATQLDRPDVGDTVRAQLVAADLIALTKVDLVADAGSAALAVVEPHSQAPVVVAPDGVIDPNVVLGLTAVNREAAPVLAPSSDHGYRVTTHHVGDVPRLDLERWLDKLPVTTLRAKGIVRCSDTDHPIEVNVVGRRRRLQVRPDIERADGMIVVIDR